MGPRRGWGRGAGGVAARDTRLVFDEEQALVAAPQTGMTPAKLCWPAKNVKVDPIAPMLATPDPVPEGKWDGVRAVTTIADGQLRAQSRKRQAPRRHLYRTDRPRAPPR